MTMCSGQKIVNFCIMSKFVVAILDLGTETLTFFEFFLVTEALLCCRVVLRFRCPEAKQLSRAQLWYLFDLTN